ncbi:MAG: cysteine-rich CWC family protein [Pyrinomonadaceae bacterium]
MMLPVFPDTARLKVCSKCGASFTCGPEEGREKCWCDALPHIPRSQAKRSTVSVPNVWPKQFQISARDVMPPTLGINDLASALSPGSVKFRYAFPSPGGCIHP